MKTGSKFTALAFPLFAVLSATALQAQDGRVEGCRDSVRPAFVQPGNHYENRTRFNASDRRGDFEVVGVVTSACDTAWGVTSEPFPVPSGVRAFSLEFSIRASMDWYVVDAWKRWESLVEWLDGKGDIIGMTPFRPRFIRDAFAFFRIRGEIPAAARSGRGAPCGSGRGGDRHCLLEETNRLAEGRNALRRIRRLRRACLPFQGEDRKLTELRPRRWSVRGTTDKTKEDEDGMHTQEKVHAVS